MTDSDEDQIRDLKTENNELKKEIKRLSKQMTVAIKKAEKYSGKLKEIIDGLIADVESIKALEEKK
jgi:seryl-tRNA synthetase